MKRRKPFLALLLAAVMCLSMAACSSGGNAGGGDADAAPQTDGDEAKSIEDITVGLSVGHTTEERWQREVKMFQDYADAHGYTLVTQIAQNSVEKQVSQCENLIAQGIDVLIVQSLDAEACVPIVQAAHEAGIKVIAYDRFIMNCDLDYYITFDSFKVGEVQAEFVTSKAPSGNYIWLKGSPDDNNAHLVADGQRSVLQPFIDAGEINIVLEQWVDNWDPNVAMDHTENGLSLVNNDIQGVIASNDGTAGGAVQALAEQGLAGIVPIAGQDADLAACQRIVEGTQTGTVYKPLAMLNQAACEVAVAIATGEDPMTSVSPELGSWQSLNNNYKDVDSFTVDVVAIDADNMNEIIIQRDQFHTVEEVYANIPQDQWPS